MYHLHLHIYVYADVRNMVMNMNIDTGAAEDAAEDVAADADVDVFVDVYANVSADRDGSRDRAGPEADRNTGMDRQSKTPARGQTAVASGISYHEDCVAEMAQWEQEQELLMLCSLETRRVSGSASSNTSVFVSIAHRKC